MRTGDDRVSVSDFIKDPLRDDGAQSTLFMDSVDLYIDYWLLGRMKSRR